MKKLLILALICSCASLVVSCAEVKTAAKAAETAAIDCAKTDILKPIVAEGPTLVAATVEVISKGDSGWKDLLAELGKQAGDDALACAVKSAQAGLAAGHHFATSAGAARAQSYMDERGWRFAGSQ